MGGLAQLAAAAASLLLASAFSVAAFWRVEGVPSYDVYAAHYPNLIYALRALEEGHGLLWNRLQNCGQPFIPSTLVGLFYPLHWLFLWVPLDAGFSVLAVVHVTIGGLGAYLLSRELGVSWPASLCGAWGFALSGIALSIAGWQATGILGVYVWTPVALWLCERMLRRPSFGAGVGLAGVLAVQLLPGYPQLNLFTYQLIGLRVLYELVLRPRDTARLLPAFAVALALAPLLAAAQLIPMAEFARESVRSDALSPDDIRSPMTMTWVEFRRLLAERGPPGAGSTFTGLALALAGPALLHPTRRRAAVFWLAAAALFFALSFDNWLFDVYQRLPMGRAFRHNDRFLFSAAFALAVTGAIGADALMQPTRVPRSRAARLALALVPGVAVLWAVSPSGVWAFEWALVAAAAAAAAPPLRRFAVAIVPALLLANLVWVNRTPFFSFVDGAVFYRHAEAFAMAPVTLQDRVYVNGKLLDYGLSRKTGSVFGVPVVDDYEPQTSRRFAELVYKLVHGPRFELPNLRGFMFGTAGMASSRPLLDLMAARWWIVDRSEDRRGSVLAAKNLRPVWEQGDIAVYENRFALPRAFYVAQAIVIPDPQAALTALAAGSQDPRRFAALEALPADGFLGEAPGATGSARIASDRSEEVVVETQASAAGFLFLSDQLYPGWSATVNGAPAEILRANHAFRLVRVPAGASTVVFRYRPRSVWAGLAVSAGTVALVLVASLVRLRMRARPRRAGLTPATRSSAPASPPTPGGH
jgi:hypothetical protein